MFHPPSLHKPDGYEQAIQEIFWAGITLKTHRLVKADCAGTSKPMSKDAFHDFLQKRTARYEAAIESINQLLLDIQDSTDIFTAALESAIGALRLITTPLAWLRNALSRIKSN